MQCQDKQHESAHDPLPGELILQLVNATDTGSACDAVGLSHEARSAIQALSAVHGRIQYLQAAISEAEQKEDALNDRAVALLQGFDAGMALTQLQSIATGVQ